MSSSASEGFGKCQVPSFIKGRRAGPTLTPLIGAAGEASLPLFELPVQICLPDGRKERTLALLDSGACGLYLDSGWAQEKDIPKVSEKVPEQVLTVDGSPFSSGPVTEMTVPLGVTFGSHQESVSFDLINSPNHTILLGLPWLIRHNPYINWATQTLSLSSQFCHDHCYSSGDYWTPNDKAQRTVLDSEVNLLLGLPVQYQDYIDIFEKPKQFLLPPHQEFDCSIQTDPEATIPFGRIYSLSESEKEVLRQYLEENLENGLISRSSSPAGASMFFVPKKSKELRPCIDYRGLNDITIKDRYPLPLIKDVLEAMRGSKIFTKLDLRGAYHLLWIWKADEWKMAFRTPLRHFKYRVMPFGDRKSVV